jgi:NADH dehydrogenase FAD-containing subunit
MKRSVFLTAVVSGLVVVGAGFSALANASGSGQAQVSASSVSSVSPASRFVEMTVRPGETLWSIASSLADSSSGSESVGEIVEEIMVVNKLTKADLIAGAKIKVPIN